MAEGSANEIRSDASRGNRLLVMGCIVLAGESIFSLPFHVPRYFRASVLEAFSLSNAELGDAFAVYGLTAMLAYAVGGPLADRYPARALMSSSLVATALGGVYLTTLPGAAGIRLLFGYWGLTTILFFWAAMIRATRGWGGVASQGRAFGILDAGRGAIAAGLASLAVLVFGALVPSQTELVSEAQRAAGLRAVIAFYSAATLVAALLCWRLIPDTPPDGLARDGPLHGVAQVVRRPGVWLTALVVVCAYSGYKGLDNYSLYAVQVLGLSEVEAARFTAASAWIRPVGAFSAGLLADRFTARRVIAWIFAVLLAGYAFLGLAVPAPGALAIVYANLLVSFFGVFALRGIYFALLEETRVPSMRTGAAVGLISFVGYTPDVFYAAVAGRLLDASPGLPGHQHVFWLLTGIAACGAAAAFVLGRLARRAPAA